MAAAASTSAAAAASPPNNDINRVPDGIPPLAPALPLPWPTQMVNAIKQYLDCGSLSFGVKILAIVRYRNGKWKTRSQFLRAYCGGVSFGFTSIDKPGIFLNPYQDCEVYLDTN